ncbi:MAG: relaxase, partial [Solirubrobacterales bacterium]|nr:relaxase [Solirubrobacterales bacterium]
RTGLSALPRETLARAVRACASASADEAEFVRRLRRSGVRARPRYAAGRGDVVSGYSVALRPPKGEAPIWYSGGQLARDLTLPRLRAGWPDSPQGAAAAVHEWAAAKRNQPSGVIGREASEPDPELWARYSSEIAELRERLRSVPPEDRATWAHVAGESAGAFAAWSLQVEATPGPLAATAESLARSAQLRAHAVRPLRAPLPSMRGASLLLASIAHGGQGTVSQAVLLRQLANVAKALHDSHRAAGEAQRAAAIERVVREQLATVGTSMPGPTLREASVVDEQALQAARVASQGQMTPRPPGSPVPTPIAEPEPKPAVAQPRETEIQR